MGLLVSSPEARVSAVDRERVGTRLREACADDRLSLNTFMHRLDLLYEARTDGEVQALVADLPRSRPFHSRLAQIAELTAECAAVWTNAWGRATAPRLVLPPQGSIVIGRSHDCRCVVADPTVSRRHARLTHTARGWALRDLLSSNGTYVNGVRIADTASVQPGDDVWFGSARFRLVRGQA
jgi:hypothetical protein